MSLPPAWWAIPWFENLEAHERMRAREADEQQINAKYENPEQLAWEMAQVNSDLYWWAFIPPEERDDISSVDGNTWDEHPEAILSKLNAIPWEPSMDIWEQSEFLDTQNWNTSEFWPLFERFSQFGMINPESLKELSEANIDSENYASKIPTIGSLDDTQRDEITQAINYFVKRNPADADTTLQREYKEVFADYISKWWDGNIQWQSTADKDAYKELCNHFIGQWDRWQQDAQLELWFEMACNKLSSRVDVQMWRSDIALEKAQNIIRNPGSFQKKFEALAKIAQLASNWVAAAWRWKQSLDYREKIQASIANAWLTQEFQQAQLELIEAQKANDTMRITAAQEAIESLANKAEIDGWDLFAIAWDIDAWPDTAWENTREA